MQPCFQICIDFKSYRQPGKTPVAEKITQEVLCLPIFPDLGAGDVGNICNIVRERRSPHHR